MLEVQVRQPNWDPAIRGQAQAAQDKAHLVMEKVGEAMVAWLQSLTEEERGWATITGELAAGYNFQAIATDDGAKLILRNDTSYAPILEHIDGMFVLTGVLDPGGPVEQRLTEVLAEFAPEWKIVRRG